MSSPIRCPVFAVRELTLAYCRAKDKPCPPGLA